MRPRGAGRAGRSAGSRCAARRGGRAGTGGIGCEAVEYDLPGIGKLTRTEAESLNFADMDEGRWDELWDGGTGDGGWIGWLRREVFGGLAAESREAVELIIQKPQEAA